YAAAAGHLSLSRTATAAPPDQPTAARPASTAPGEIGCCPDGPPPGTQLISAGQKDEPAKNGQKPNIVFIMGDDVGWFNIGAYHQGIMAGKTPNLDRLASQGMRFTDYYAEASCTAGRASFITGEIPLRTGLTTVGQAGADVGMPAQACTIATALKAQ